MPPEGRDCALPGADTGTGRAAGLVQEALAMRGWGRRALRLTGSPSRLRLLTDRLACELRCF